MHSHRVLLLVLVSIMLLTGCQPSQQETTSSQIIAALPTSTATTTSPPPRTPLAPTVSSGPAATLAPTPIPGTILAQQSASIDAETGSQMQMYLAGLSGQAIRVDAVLFEGSVDYHLTIIDPFGNSLATLETDVGSLADFIAEFSLPYDGTYTIAVIPAEGAGMVQVTVSSLAATSGGGALTGVGEAISGLLNVPNTHHTYQFTLQPGETVRIAAEAETDGAPDTYMAILDQDGFLLAEVDDTASGLDAVLGNFWSENGGAYVVIVSAYENTAGQYTFSVTPVTEDIASDTNVPDIFYNSTYTGNFADGSHLQATFDGHVGEVLRVEIFEIDAELDLDVILYGPYGEPLAASALGAEGISETISEIQLPFNGRYRLEFIPSGNGRAQFLITQLTQDNLTGGGNFGETTEAIAYGSIQAQNTFHTYQFTASQGDTITLTIISSSEQGNLNLGFVVLNPGGQQTASADSADGNPTLSNYTISETGTYTIIVYSFNDAIGAYELRYGRE